MADEKDIKLSGDAQKVMDIVEKMTVLELNDLVKALEEKFGVTAAAPMMMGAMMPAAGNGGEPAEPVEEKTEFDVVLTEAGANKISVIKSVREINPLKQFSKEQRKKQPRLQRKSLKKLELKLS
ncbi:MAG: 50S ribosomal protein L7/L12 [candidate division WWE3 bacterium GW2011_GWC2_44_85]|nr:MAG: 50S ribosomal protein L7/L12 [candidate division WWE3 bacterium GW2011_GWC2_44_85]